jgi:L-lactate dehydrogenase complex protein LldG
MNKPSSRELILNRINRAAEKLLSKQATTLAYQQKEIYRPIGTDMLNCFKQELEMVNGQCFICNGEEDMYLQLAALVDKKDLPYLYSRDVEITRKLRNAGIKVENNDDAFEQQTAGITCCDLLIARTGSIVVSTAKMSGRQMHVFPPIHIVLAKESQLVSFPGDALEFMMKKFNGNLPSAMTIITGPSRTADIEKTLVLGAHGPKELIIFVDKSQ